MLTLIPAIPGLALPTTTTPHVRLTDSVFPLMTDFRASPVITVTATTQIDRAIDHMIATGVRLCFVLDADGLLIGAITSYDIQGDKPMRYLQSLGSGLRSASRRDVLVRHIMEPLADLKVVTVSEAERATVGEAIAALKRLGRSHLIVVEQSAGRQTLRGLLSATRIEQATGLVLDVVPEARSFAEIERAVEHPE